MCQWTLRHVLLGLTSSTGDDIDQYGIPAAITEVLQTAHQQQVQYQVDYKSLGSELSSTWKYSRVNFIEPLVTDMMMSAVSSEDRNVSLRIAESIAKLRLPFSQQHILLLQAHTYFYTEV